MKRLLVTMLLLVAGCDSGVGLTGSQPAKGGDSTGLRAGLYSGTLTCENMAVDTCEGGTPDAWTDQTTKTVTIGDSGLPIVEGQEVSEGATTPIEIGGMTASGAISEVTVSANGVVVRMDAEITVADGERMGLCVQELWAVVSTTYKADGQGGIDHTWSMIMADEFGPIGTVECQGILAP